jgi:hypothetical protein
MTAISYICSLRRTTAWSAITSALLIVITFGPLFARPQNSSRDQKRPAPDSLFQRVIDNQEHCEKLLDEYERVVRTEARKPATGSNDPVDTKVYLAFPIGTGSFKIPMADGKSPAPDIYRDNLEKLQKYLDWLSQDGPAQQEAYAKADRKKKDRLDLLHATYHAFIFARDGDELRQGRTLLRYSLTPDPAYKPPFRNAMLFSHVRGTVWIDEESGQMAKIEGTVTEDISLGLFLAKVYKGSHFMQERYEIAPGIWEPTFEQYDFDGRKFFSSFSIHERTFYSSYKRVGPPKEAVEFIRAELNKTGPEASRH